MKKIAIVFALLAAAAWAGKPTLIGDPAAATKPAAATGPAAPAAATAEPVEPDAPEKAIGRFFAYLQRKEVDQAYDQLTRGTKIAERAEDVKMLKSKTKDALAVYGAIQGYETVATKKVGERVMRQTVVSLGKEFPLRWRFYFYRIGENWRLIDMRVDDRLSALFDELEAPQKTDEVAQ